MSKDTKQAISEVKQLHSRRKFLRTGGLIVAGSSLILTSCSDNDPRFVPAEPGPNPNPNPDPDPDPNDEVFDLGEGDIAVLNYAYALEQLEAKFYEMVLDGSYWGGANDEERNILEDLYYHEAIHRDFFKTALNAVTDSANVLPELEFDFSSVDFSSRESVLQTAKTLEDTGVSAYNGGGAAIQNVDYLVLAGKIVSVEARHASAIRSLLNPNSKDFAGDDVIDDNGLDLAKAPSEVIPTAKAFITTEFTANNLP